MVAVVGPLLRCVELLQSPHNRISWERTQQKSTLYRSEMTSPQPDDLVSILAEAKLLARRYLALTGRPLGVTGEIAEYEAIRLLGLELAPVRQSGWDAVDPTTGIRYQIKGRVLKPSANPGQRLGTLTAAKEWDAVLLVILDENYEAQVIWEATREAALQRLERPGSRARSERGQLGVQELIRVAKLRWGTPPRSTKGRPRVSNAAELRSDGAVRYKFSRLCFKADLIEPLPDNGVFEVDTLVGLFRMTKSDFIEVFPGVRASKSYQEGRIYHFPQVPRRAEQFRV